MVQDIYRKLARHLDDLPGGFPPTESGVELRILRRLFLPEEARLTLHLNLIPEEAGVIARRAGISRQEAESRLDQMARKGLIFSLEKKGSPAKYMAAQFVIGIWEYHVNDLDPELVRDMNEYIPTLLNHETWSKAPQLRTIPVGRSIEAPMEVLDYERAEALVRERQKILVAPCICRREHRIVGEGCDRPEETCLIFGAAADYYEQNGLGRVISAEEALEILKGAEEAGLVLQPSNAQKIVNICCCCGCCCQILKNLKRHPAPGTLVTSAFLAKARSETCKGCGKCLERCQMDALSLKDQKVELRTERCIGCGLCVTTCPTHSLSLVRRPQEEQRPVPADMIEALIRLGQARGKLGSLDLAKMKLKS